jgi:hypothetical protein
MERKIEKCMPDTGTPGPRLRVTISHDGWVWEMLDGPDAEPGIVMSGRLTPSGASASGCGPARRALVDMHAPETDEQFFTTRTLTRAMGSASFLAHHVALALSNYRDVFWDEINRRKQ